jgi:heptosyltransferase-2
LSEPAVAPARVLVHLPNWLGDVIMARPLLHALRAAWPGAGILGVGPPALLALPAGEGTLDDTVAWPRERAGRRTAEGTVRRWGAETALVLPGSFSSAWLAWRSGARVRVGYRGEGRDLLLTRALPRSARGDRHLSEEFLELAATLGVPPAAVPGLRPTPEGARLAAELLGGAGLAGEPYALLGPRSAYGPAREWFADRFVAAGRGLAARGLRVVVCGTAGEADACASIAAGIGEPARSVAGRTGLPALVAGAPGAPLALGNRYGQAHVAAAAGAPTLQIYGSASSAWTAARGRRVRVLHRAPVCSPCWQRTCRIGTRCLDAVTVAWVLEQADALLAEAA